MKKRAFVICGPESSGNRLMLRLMQAAGCQAVDRMHYLHLLEGPLVWCHSVPYNRKWEKLDYVIGAMQTAKFRVTGVALVRDWWPMVNSQVRAGHVTTLESAADNARRAYGEIFGAFHRSRIEFLTFTMSGLVMRPQQSIEWLMEGLGLNVPPDFEAIQDPDNKYWLGRPPGRTASRPHAAQNTARGNGVDLVR